ncbi:hypothetical protein Nepgr_005965 [Nepenthes gracilis]|uniref:Pectinesterase n=1 Tax=Nepenthes gracilis TaxID=150966 RepID=A0AAD3XH45_NEPGR|nr:hypothetical protein Nepgr_005965 [Nepenthes gracilis]
METAAIIKNPTEHSKKLSRTHPSKKITLVVCLTMTIIPIASLLMLAFDGHERNHRTSTTHQPAASTLHPLIKTACSRSLYPSLCFTSVAALASKNTSSLHHVIELAIHHVAKLVTTSQLTATRFFTPQELNRREKNALNDCMEMLDQTLYELQLAIDDLHTFPEPVGRSYSNLKTLLSAAMTNENTCVGGFSDLEEANTESNNEKEGLGVYLEIQMTPISRMISHCLAILKYLENSNLQEMRYEKGALRGSRNLHPSWMTPRERKMMDIRARLRPDIVVASDGSGDCKTIGEAVKMAPNMRVKRFVIKIKAGVYAEKVEIPRNKVNIMLVGDGMGSTVITGSRCFDDGFSTFESATLTIVGDRFLARDLAIVNTAGPDKHQAVAARVTANSAFYRCNFSSYQDTLYAHSLRQFYRDCTIQGTVDFIFGNAAAILQNCLVHVRKPRYGQSNVVTAQGREDPNQNTGIAMHNCTVKAASDFAASDQRFSSTYLGRPWRNHSRTVIMKSYLGDLINPQGWRRWDEYSNLDTVEYIEYMNFGPGSDTRGRVHWGGYKKNCSEAKAKQFTERALLRGYGDWLESTGFPLFHDP